MEKRNYEFPIVSINKEEYEAVRTWIIRYKDMVSEDGVYIFGAGIRGNMILKLLEEADIQVRGFLDNSVEKQGGFVKTYKIFAPADVFNEEGNDYFIVSPENSSEIEELLKSKGYEKNINYFLIDNTIYNLYQRQFFRKDGEIKYILFGDCYFTEIDVEDLQEQSIGELVVERLGKEKTKVLSIHGMCIPTFYHLMKLQLKLGIVPNAVAFIVNVPFCNSIQTKLPQSQHIELLKAIQKNVSEKNEDFDLYVETAEKRSQNLSANSFSTRGSAKSRTDDYVEKLLVKTRYMYDFKEDNENIEYLKKMIKLLQKNGIKPVPFIPSLNYHAGINFYGQEFIDKYSKICRQIKGCLQEYHVEILDMSFMLGEEYFTGKRLTKFPNYEGKQKEISLLCEQMQS